MTKTFLQWISSKPLKVVLQTRNHKKKKKKNETKQKQKASRRNNDNDVGIFAMLKYGRNEKMTFCILIGHERQKRFGGIFIFIRRVPPSTFVVVTVLLTHLRKGYFLRRRPNSYRLLMAEIAVLMMFFFVCFFIFGCTLLAEFQCGLDLCMMDGYNLSRIMLMFFTTTSPLRTAQPLRKHMWVTMDQRFQISICFKAFQYIRICQRNTGVYQEHLLR